MSRMIVPLISILFYLVGYYIITIVKISNTDQIKQLQKHTSNHLDQLINTKFFRIIRLNLNQQCPLTATNRVCTSITCKTCKCPQNDASSIQIENNKIFSRGFGIQQWQTQRKNQTNWIWNVEDQQNDKGQYYDLSIHTQSHTNYNSSQIWKLIYQQNCFAVASKNACKQQKILYRLISGLHTSISTYLSMNYLQSSTQGMQWLVKPTIKLNLSQYQRRVLQHPQRINNLFFLYEILAKAIKEIRSQLTSNFNINSDNIFQDLKAIHHMNRILQQFDRTDYGFRPKESLSFFSTSKYRLGEYQKFIHNISRIMNCIDCQKCKLFGKMQIYGIGTALKILIGHKQHLKRNQIVALFNSFNKISKSIDIYYQQNRQQIKLQHLQPQFSLLQLYYFIFGAIVVVIYVFSRVDIDKRVKKNFKYAFPPNNSRFKIT